MPELPEVESVCRLMRRVLKGKRIAEAHVAEDEIVLGGVSADAIRQSLVNHTVREIGRKGKYWWIELEDGPALCGHLGMSGWIRHLESPERRLLNHGKAALDTEEGVPRFLKLMLTAEDGERIAFTDGRRLGRLWLCDSPAQDSRIAALGPDAFIELPDPAQLGQMLAKRKAPIKALLLDQGFLSGLGNYLADEILYQAKISPKRSANSLTAKESGRIHNAIESILRQAIEMDADSDRFPSDWLFHHRWGGAKGKEFIDGKKIVRETVGGRTTAWVPEIQV